MHCSGKNLIIAIVDYGTRFERVTIEDDGANNGFGLLSAHAGAGFIGGRFEIESVPGGGTAVTIMMPLGPASGKAPAAMAA